MFGIFRILDSIQFIWNLDFLIFIHVAKYADDAIEIVDQRLVDWSKSLMVYFGNIHNWYWIQPYFYEQLPVIIWF